MAPRGRPRKRHKKMDKAVEAMMKFGFSDEELVKKVANELLNEYGGEDGWAFMEQDSYIELLEAILRYQEANSQENNRQENSAGGGDSIERNYLQGGTAENHSPAAAAGPSVVVAEPVRSEVVENGLEKDSKEDINHLPSIERDGKGRKDIVLHQSTTQREIGNSVSDIEENSGANEDPGTSSRLSPALIIPTAPLTGRLPSRLGTSPLLSPSPVIHSPATADSARRPRGLPCYGWIESDEEDIDDFIELKPAIQVTADTTADTTAESREYPSCRMDTEAKHKSRWDLRPDDP